MERLPQPCEELVRAVVLYAKAPKEVEEYGKVLRDALDYGYAHGAASFTRIKAAVYREQRGAAQRLALPLYRLLGRRH